MSNKTQMPTQNNSETNTHLYETNTHLSEKNHHGKYYAGYISISVIVGLFLLVIIIMTIISGLVLYGKIKAKTLVFDPYFPTPAPNTGLYQPNAEYYQITLTPEQIQKKQEMINAARLQSNIS